MLRDDPAVYIRSLQFFHNGCWDNMKGSNIASPNDITVTLSHMYLSVYI